MVLACGATGRPCRSKPWVRFLTVVTVLGLVGCDLEKLPQPPKPEGQVPATPEAIAAEIDKGLQPLYEFIPR